MHLGIAEVKLRTEDAEGNDPLHPGPEGGGALGVCRCWWQGPGKPRSSAQEVQPPFQALTVKLGRIKAYSNAERVGLKEWDYVWSINGQEVRIEETDHLAS